MKQQNSPFWPLKKFIYDHAEFFFFATILLVQLILVLLGMFVFSIGLISLPAFIWITVTIVGFDFLVVIAGIIIGW